MAEFVTVNRVEVWNGARWVSPEAVVMLDVARCVWPSLLGAVGRCGLQGLRVSVVNEEPVRDPPIVV